MHLALERIHEFGLSTTQKLRSVIDINRIILRADEVDARRAAAMDLM
jgi:hypothetical protein